MIVKKQQNTKTAKSINQSKPSHFFTKQKQTKKNFPTSKLKKIFGVGKFFSKEVFKRLGVSEKSLFFFKKFNEVQKSMISKYLCSFLSLGKFAKTFIKDRINFFYKIKSMRGYRHHWGYPTKHQRTRSNARTARKHRIKLKYKSNYIR